MGLDIPETSCSDGIPHQWFSSWGNFAHQGTDPWPYLDGDIFGGDS